ncbi:glycerophosphodiester phosphodiesterase [Catenovulum adriaticum]|uniref:Glycerophosphodiester phosphodiesterase family protein n=1 Tax=Catenovulum adriaticum TaxID=2984846 RepID=A0ABY7AN73_9ALTE|nr:glycerophosphodiester phosphodiesterase family protein [Catenovulum sp. TS8]WAJ70959.1 glycerophosphodiester phosphodiesterase family protein [Catenovulum sp. TS8]
MQIIAHRGASGTAPENTITAFQLALDAGVSGIELDVQMVSGVAVVLHDRWLQKTTNGMGLTQDIDLAYLQSLDAGGGQSVPRLGDVLQLINGSCLVNIELKAPDCELAVLAEIEYALAALNFSVEQFLISSFNHHSLQKIKQLAPELKLGALTANLPLSYAQFATDIQAWSVHCAIDFIDQAFVDDAHQRGLQVWVYTVNQIEDIDAMLKLGVDAIFTDYPSRSIQYLNSISC